MRNLIRTASSLAAVIALVGLVLPAFAGQLSGYGQLSGKVTGSTPGGDYKVAHPDRRYDPYGEYSRPAYPRYAPNRNYRRYGYNEIRPRAQRRRRAFQRRRQAPPRYRRRAPRRGNWFRAPAY